jgi:hypothetical protein
MAQPNIYAVPTNQQVQYGGQQQQYYAQQNQYATPAYPAQQYMPQNNTNSS